MHSGRRLPCLQVFDSYGDIERLRTFSDQEAAAVQFSDAGAAARVRCCLLGILFVVKRNTPLAPCH